MGFFKFLIYAILIGIILIGGVMLLMGFSFTSVIKFLIPGI